MMTVHYLDKLLDVRGDRGDFDIAPFLIEEKSGKIRFCAYEDGDGHDQVVIMCGVNPESVIVGGWYSFDGEGILLQGKSTSYPTRVPNPDSVVMGFEEPLRVVYGERVGDMRVRMEKPAV